jgi:large subunit ribosomal protein L25
MANSELQVAPRSVLGKNVAKLRRDGVTPANVFGNKLESAAVQADTAAVTQLLRGISKNAIINLHIQGEGAPRTVVVRDVTRQPVTGKLLHIDFFQVSMTEKMKADVRVVLTGTSPAVSTYGGVLLQTLDTVAVEALPADIPAEFEVDVSQLTELEMGVHVRDLSVDASKVTVHSDPDVIVARVAAPRLATAEEEEAEAAAAAEGAEAPAEGAEAAPATTEEQPSES